MSFLSSSDTSATLVKACASWAHSELWRKSLEYDTLEKVLDVIRASEAAALNQSAAAGQATSRINLKCFNCDKSGNMSKSSPPPPKCRFCGGPKRCKATECKAFEMKCAGGKKFSHFQKYCNEISRLKARESQKNSITASMTAMDGEPHSLCLMRLSTSKKEEKKVRQRENRAKIKVDTKKVVVKNDVKDKIVEKEVIYLNNLSKPQQAQSIIWCP